MYSKIAAVSALVAAVSAQSGCESTPERHPPLTWQRCAAGGTCTNVNAAVVLDSNWRWTHTTGSSVTNCYTGNSWNPTICPDGTTCSQSCCLDSANYLTTYGISTSGSSLNLRFVTRSSGTNVGSRVYLMEPGTQDRYQMFNLLNNEFTFDVDVSTLACGLNGALYFVSMDPDGGASQYPLNTAGAKWGTGYCDSQCPRDMKFIGGRANVEGWGGSNADSGVGDMGACCAEMDIWEANSISTAYTPHPCEDNSYHICDSDDCGGTYSPIRYAGDCDPDGCDFNSWRQGNRTFYGPGSGFTIDTTRPITVVTQFHTTNGLLSDIRRVYVQNGRVISNSQSVVPPGNSITEDWCDAQKSAFGDVDIFSLRGGLAQMGRAAESMVLVLSLWDDFHSNMLWLDSTYPTDATGPGASRGSCSTTSGAPADVRANHPNANVIFSNIKFGPIGSTYNSGNPPVSSSSSRPASTSTRASSSSSSSSVRPSSTTVVSSIRTSTSTSSSRAPTASAAPLFGQCGGQNWNGPTTCVSGACCVVAHQWYSQCLAC